MPEIAPPQDNPPWFATCLDALCDPQNQRVWSVIVSLFGDLAQAPGARISGQALNRVIQPMGIKPEAIRVALHRLRKDGWLDSARAGRASIHFLTEGGRAQSAAVTPRIYARRPQPARDWHLLLAEDGTGAAALDEFLMTSDATQIARNAALCPGPLPEGCEDFLALRAEPEQVPAWVQAQICPQELRDACRALRAALDTCLAVNPAAQGPSPAQIATLRTLIVHRWRRVVLRHPDLPDAFFPGDWCGPACRERVFRLLDTLPRPVLDRLDTDAAA